jgi:hypothetical protein
MTNRLSPEMFEKYEGTPRIRQHSDGHWIADMFMQHSMPDEAYLDLLGRVRIRKYQTGDGKVPMAAPPGMQLWVEIDLKDRYVCRWWFVDDRIVFVVQNWFNLNEILLLAPSHWPAALKNQYPNAIPSVCLHGD